MKKRFPVIWGDRRNSMAALKAAGCPVSVPWEFVAPYEDQALQNHSQTLERLAERGGLGVAELVILVTRRPLSHVYGLSDVEAVPRLWELLDEFEKQRNGLCSDRGADAFERRGGGAMNERYRPEDLQDLHHEGDPPRGRSQVVIEWTACVDHFNFWLSPRSPGENYVVVWFPEQESPPTNFAAILTSVQMRALASLLSGRPETDVYPIFVRKDV